MKNRKRISHIKKGYLNDLWKYSNGSWTWISGNNTINALGIYGTKGISSPSNYPGARQFAVGGIDSSSFNYQGYYWSDIQIHQRAKMIQKNQFLQLQNI